MHALLRDCALGFNVNASPKAGIVVGVYRPIYSLPTKQSASAVSLWRAVTQFCASTPIAVIVHVTVLFIPAGKPPGRLVTRSDSAPSLLLSGGSGFKSVMSVRGNGYVRPSALPVSAHRVLCYGTSAPHPETAAALHRIDR